MDAKRQPRNEASSLRHAPQIPPSPASAPQPRNALYNKYAFSAPGERQVYRSADRFKRFGHFIPEREIPMKIRQAPLILLCLFGLGSSGCDHIKLPKNQDPEASKPRDGKLGSPCGGTAGALCKDELYCQHALSDQCGAADAQGSCALRPDACKEEYDPVCGCDGQTHGNACDAAFAGVSVSYLGACQEPGSQEPAPEDHKCGGPKQIPCEANLFCNYPSNDACGVDQAFGTCTTRSDPNECGDSEDLVCGCDGKTYANPCLAHAQGQSIYKHKACENNAPAKLGQSCGGQDLPASCEPGLYCDFPIKANCGEADIPGTCKILPKACDTHYDPVCGCDNTTHSNACVANSLGVSVSTPGQCEAPAIEGEHCGSKGMSACEEGLF